MIDLSWIDRVSVRDKWWCGAGINGEVTSEKKWAPEGAHFLCKRVGHAWSSSAMALRMADSSRICLLSAMPTRSAVVHRRFIWRGMPLV